jgi:SAM-dependent methyltransferase
MAPDTSRVLPSFRDPSGNLARIDNRIFRLVNACGKPSAERFLASTAVRNQIERGCVIDTWRASEAESKEIAAAFEVSPDQPLFLEHELVPFPSYPSEWPREMLHAAAVTTVELCEQLLGEGLCLKDATPYNILYRGTRPVFVDVLSIEARDPLDPVWLPYAQFMTSFVLPLMAAKELGIPLEQIFLASREGLEPEEFYRWLGVAKKLKPSMLFGVVVPVFLGRLPHSEDPKVYRKRTLNDPERAAYGLRHLFSELRKRLKPLGAAGGSSSEWSTYESQNSYSDEAALKKRELVTAMLERIQPKNVLDVGCNRGFYSRFAARFGASVVGIDSDPAVVGQAYAEAKREGLNILSLVVDISRPTPAVGWMNKECLSFLQRATKQFDMVLALAVVHHLVVTERIPVSQVMQLISRLTTDAAIVEYVSPEDVMFKKLSRGRDHLYEGFSEEAFAIACRKQFAFLERHSISETRKLFLLREPIG